MEKKEKLPDSLLKTPFWGKVDHAIWLASCIALHRNLSAFPFPKHLNDQQAAQIAHAIVEAFPPSHQNAPLSFYPQLSSKDKELLFDRFLLTEGFENQTSGRGIIASDEASFLGLVNFEDHLVLQCFTKTPDLETFYKSVEDFETSLATKLSFSFSPRFGFLTTDPLTAGTGLVAQTFLHLPLLIHTGKLDDLFHTLPSDIVVRGLGNEGEYLADLVLLENRYKMGVTEKDLLSSLVRASSLLAEAEQEARKAPALIPSPLKDQIARAYGLLSHTLSVKTGEALSSLSLLHLAKELGWLQNAPQFDFFDLFFSTRRSHLLLDTPHKEEDLPTLRAELIRNSLAGSILTVEQK